MIKFQMSGFNDFDELVIMDILATDYQNALFTAKFFDLDDIVLEELDKVFFTN